MDLFIHCLFILKHSENLGVFEFSTKSANIGIVTYVDRQQGLSDAI